MADKMSLQNKHFHYGNNFAIAGLFLAFYKVDKLH